MKKDTVIIRPLYSPLDSLHMNCFLRRRKPGFKTFIREITSAGKQSNYDIVNIGEWHYYSPSHELVEKRYFNHGELLEVEKISN